LIEQVSWSILQPREMSTMEGWLDALPNEVVRSRPRLGLVRAWILAAAGQWDAVDRSLADIDVQHVQGEAAAIRVYIAARKGDIAGTIKYAQRALKQLPAEDMFLRATVALDLGVAYSSRDEPEAAEQALNEAITISQAAGRTYLTLAAISTLGHLRDTQGLLHRAVETQKQALELAHEPGGQPIPIAGMAYVGLAEVLYEWNDLDAAQHNAMQGIKLLELGGFPYYRIIGLTILARVHQAWGDLDRAMDMIHEAKRLAQKYQKTPINSMINVMRVQHYVAQGNIEAAYRWARAHCLNLDDGLENAPEVEQIMVAWVVVKHACSQGDRGEIDKAQSLLERLLEGEKEAGRMWRVIEILVLQSLAYQALSEMDKATSVLDQALSLAEPEGYIRTFVDQGEIMERLLLRAMSQNIAPNYVGTLLAALRESAEISQTKAHPLIDPLSERELEVLRLIAAGLSNQEIAQQLVIAVSTVKSHINHIYGKLSVNSRTQAVVQAKALGLL
jgi:LuxR family maltose regulon positive regulatory protein